MRSSACTWHVWPPTHSKIGHTQLAAAYTKTVERLEGWVVEKRTHGNEQHPQPHVKAMTTHLKRPGRVHKQSKSTKPPHVCGRVRACLGTRHLQILLLRPLLTFEAQQLAFELATPVRVALPSIHPSMCACACACMHVSK